MRKIISFLFQIQRKTHVFFNFLKKCLKTCLNVFRDEIIIHVKIEVTRGKTKSWKCLIDLTNTINNKPLLTEGFFYMIDSNLS